MPAARLPAQVLRRLQMMKAAAAYATWAWKAGESARKKRLLQRAKTKMFMREVSAAFDRWAQARRTAS